MVKSSPSPTELVFSALASDTRIAILDRLYRGECTVGELAAPFDMSLAAVSKHVDVLERAGLVARERRGRTVRCRPNPRPLGEAAAVLERYRRFWEQRLDELTAYLAGEDQP